MTLLMKVSTLRGLFLFVKQTLHISAKDFAQIIEQEPQMVYQNYHESIRKKVALLLDSKAPKMIQQELIKRVPSFYLMYAKTYFRSYNILKKKVEVLKSLVEVDLKTDPGFPLLLYYNYRSVIKPRVEILKEYKLPYLLHEVLNMSDEEFCKLVQIDMETLKDYMPPKETVDEFDHFEFGDDYPTLEQTPGTS